MQFVATWTVTDYVDGVAVKNRYVRSTRDYVNTVGEAFDELRSVALVEPCEKNGMVSMIGTLNGYIYDDAGEYICAIPTMYGSNYTSKGHFCDTRNAALWPIN